MSLIEELTGALAGAFSNTEHAPEQGHGVLKLALDLINNPEIGGLSGLVKSFQEKGLGEIVSSWVGSGQNLPVSAAQIQSVLGNETLQKLIASTGLSLNSDTVAAGLSALLPQVIDKLTPHGELNESAESGASALVAQGLELLKNKLLA